MEAACKLVKLNPKKVYVNFIIELKELHGKDIFSKDVDHESNDTLKKQPVVKQSYNCAPRCIAACSWQRIALPPFSLLPFSYDMDELKTNDYLKGIVLNLRKVPVFTNI